MSRKSKDKTIHVSDLAVTPVNDFMAILSEYDSKEKETTSSKNSKSKTSSCSTKKNTDKTREKTTKTVKKNEGKPKLKKAESVGSKRPKIEKGKKIEVVDTPNTKSTNKESGLDILISFDTTGSMYPVLAQVRREVNNLVSDLKKEINDIRFGIIVHGDYCDADNPYTIRALDFTDDMHKIHDFITNSPKTYGGDADECYELVLNTAHKVMSWDDNRKKAMVLIGDANPHAVNYPQNTKRLSWRDECGILNSKGIKIFAVHALSYYRNSSTSFYKTIAELTHGTYLTLDYFSDIIELIKTTCMYEADIEKLDKYIEVIRNNNKLSNGVAKNINRLYGREIITGITDKYSRDYDRRTPTRTVQKEGLIPVMPGRFQTLTVEEDEAIRDFVIDNGIEFKRGRAFYELSKSEKVQQYKEIIIQDRSTGEMYTGAQVRSYLGLQPQVDKGGVTERLNSYHTRDYRVFVQSTSVNRRLIGGTELLYEIDE